MSGRSVGSVPCNLPFGRAVAVSPISVRLFCPLLRKSCSAYVREDQAVAIVFALTRYPVAVGKWCTVTVTDCVGQRYSLDVCAESSYEAAQLHLTHPPILDSSNRAFFLRYNS